MIKFTFHMKTYQIYKEFSRVTCSAAFYIVCDNFIFVYGYIEYMGCIEPGTPIITATLTYLARGWMLDPFITNVDFTDNIHQGQNRSHSK